MKKKEKHSFGIKGWWTIIFCGLLYYMMTGTSADGLNVMVPGFCELKGWDYSTLLSFSTIAGLVGMIIAFLTARLITKKGAKFVIVLSCIIAGAAFILYGYSSSMAMYLVTICFACGFAYVYSFQAHCKMVPEKTWNRYGICDCVYATGISYIPVSVKLADRYLRFSEWYRNYRYYDNRFRHHWYVLY